MPKTFCSNAGLPGSFTNALSYNEQIQYIINKFNELADVINNLKIDVDISDVVKYTPQTGFSELQKQQATENISAVSTIANQILDDEEQMNARENINAMEYEAKDDFVKAGGAVVYDENFTNILPNTNLASITYCEPGRYYCADVTGITGFSAAMPFEMEVYKVNSNLVRRYFQYDNGRKYVQEVELNPLKFYAVVDFGGFNVSYLLQDLTEDQKAQARANIGAGTGSGSGSAENAVLYTAQKLTDGQKTQARSNIGAGTSNVTTNDISTQINNNTVKFSDAQNLTDGQKTQARNNIGTDAGVYIGSSAPTTSDTNLWINPDNTVSGYTLPQPNLLDNSNFLNPVNQRGATSGTVTAWTYFIDRWLATDADMTYTIDNNGLHLTEGTTWIAQNVDFAKMASGITYTFAVGFNDGTLTLCSGAVPSTETSRTEFATNDDSNCYIRMAKTSSAISCSFKPKKTVTVKWAAVYEGEYSIDTLPPYVAKSYAAELIECLRYFVSVSYNNTLLSGNTGDASGVGARIYLPLGIKMRTNPTVSPFTVSASYYGGAKSNLTFTPSNVESSYTGISFYGNLSSPISTNPTYVDAIYQIRNSNLAISADL